MIVKPVVRLSLPSVVKPAARSRSTQKPQSVISLQEQQTRSPQPNGNTTDCGTVKVMMVCIVSVYLLLLFSMYDHYFAIVIAVLLVDI